MPNLNEELRKIDDRLIPKVTALENIRATRGVNAVQNQPNYKSNEQQRLIHEQARLADGWTRG